MALFYCSDFEVNGFCQKLSPTNNPQIARRVDKAHENKRYLFQLNTNTDSQIVCVEDFTKEALQKIGCRNFDEAFEQLRHCRWSVTSDCQIRCKWICDKGGNFIYLDINDVPSGVIKRLRCDHSRCCDEHRPKFGSIASSFKKVELVGGKSYDHIPIFCGDRTTTFDIRQAKNEFVDRLFDDFGVDIETYYRSLLTWIDDDIQPWVRQDPYTLKLPLPPIVNLKTGLVSFDQFDLVGCDDVKPDEDFADWRTEGDVKSIMCLGGLPPVYDAKTNQYLRFRWPEFLKEEGQNRILSETGYSTSDQLSISLRSFYRRRRSLISFNTATQVWTVSSPVSFGNSILLTYNENDV